MHWFILSLLCVLGAVSLRLEDVEDGDCRSLRLQPVPANNIDLGRMTSNFRHVIAGNRFHLYFLASGHPQFRQMSDKDLQNNMRSLHNGSDAAGNGALFGFGGRQLGNYVFRTAAGRSSVFDFLYAPSNGSTIAFVPSIQTNILTDYESFVLHVGCYFFGSSEQKTWIILSLTPDLSSSTWRTIENHVLSLGFNPNNFLFLNFNRCAADFNQLGSNE